MSWLSLVGAVNFDTWASHCGGLSCGVQVLGAGASVVVTCGFSSLWHVESSWTRDWTSVPFAGKQIPIHWTTGKSYPEDYHCPRNHLCSTSSSPNPTSNPWWSLTFYSVFTVVSFPGSPAVGITVYVAFSDWLLSCGNMHLSSFHAFSWLNGSFLFSAE